MWKNLFGVALEAIGFERLSVRVRSIMTIGRAYRAASVAAVEAEIAVPEGNLTNGGFLNPA
jgi:hypothetical protein